MNDDVSELVVELGLAPHPEGGFYRETFRSERLTSILFLLPAGGFSAFHRVRGADEAWCHHAGADVELTTIADDGCVEVVRLGRGRPQHVVPAGVWQAARAADAWVLSGCVVAPPFAFDRFDMPTRAELTALFPMHADLIARLTRSDARSPDSGAV